VDHIRYTVPSKLDIAPYGFIAKVMEDDEKFTLWIQLGGLEVPDWKPISKFFELVFSKLISNEEFMEHLLFLYKMNEPVDLSELSRFHKKL